MTSELLLTYRENTLDGKRTLRVFRDHVEISGSQFLSDSARWVVPLHTLSPTPARGKHRSRLFHFGLWAGILWGIAYYILSRLPSVELMSSRWGFFWAVPLFWLVLIAATARAVPYASFFNDSGVAVVGLAKNYPDRRKFEETVQKLSQLIREARARPLTTDDEAPPDSATESST